MRYYNSEKLQIRPAAHADILAVANLLRADPLKVHDDMHRGSGPLMAVEGGQLVGYYGATLEGAAKGKEEVLKLLHASKEGELHDYAFGGCDK